MPGVAELVGVVALHTLPFLLVDLDCVGLAACRPGSRRCDTQGAPTGDLWPLVSMTAVQEQCRLAICATMHGLSNWSTYEASATRLVGIRQHFATRFAISLCSCDGAACRRLAATCVSPSSATSRGLQESHQHPSRTHIITQT